MANLHGNGERSFGRMVDVYRSPDVVVNLRGCRWR